jgi:soluble lytic murein transglycosylase-like protein
LNNSYDAIIENAAARYGVPFTWIKAVIGTESNFSPAAYRYEARINDASYGLMQLLSETARGLGWAGDDPEELFEPSLNIELGTKLLADLRARYGDNFRRVYSAYNSGRPDLWETSAQVRHNVERAEGWLEQVIAEHPTAAAAIGGGAILAALAAFAFFRKRGK